MNGRTPAKALSKTCQNRNTNRQVRKGKIHRINKLPGAIRSQRYCQAITLSVPMDSQPAKDNLCLSF